MKTTVNLLFKRPEPEISSDKRKIKKGCPVVVAITSTLLAGCATTGSYDSGGGAAMLLAIGQGLLTGFAAAKGHTLPAMPAIFGLSAFGSAPDTSDIEPDTSSNLGGVGVALPKRMAQGGCPATLGHVSSKLPSYNDSELQSARSAVLQTDLRQALATAHSQGYTPSAAAKAALEQANQFQSARPQAESCIRASTNHPDSVIRSLQNGTYDFSGRGGVSVACAKAYVVYYYGEVANREAAVGMACLAAGS